ncbi:MAG: hypothetical protein LUD78_07980 [Clostridiales bacterium]|nr:hypothetical protein [Clostridiales bacterium]
MYCTNCGKEIKDSTQSICPYCKKSISVSAPAPEQRNASVGMNLRSAMFVICFLCAAAAVVILLLQATGALSDYDFGQWFYYGGGIFTCCALGFVALVTGVIGLCCKSGK